MSGYHRFHTFFFKILKLTWMFVFLLRLCWDSVAMIFLKSSSQKLICRLNWRSLSLIPRPPSSFVEIMRVASVVTVSPNSHSTLNLVHGEIMMRKIFLHDGSFVEIFLSENQSILNIFDSMTVSRVVSENRLENNFIFLLRNSHITVAIGEIKIVPLARFC